VTAGRRSTEAQRGHEGLAVLGNREGLPPPLSESDRVALLVGAARGRGAPRRRFVVDELSGRSVFVFDERSPSRKNRVNPRVERCIERMNKGCG
jgi:hypothetical protein